MTNSTSLWLLPDSTGPATPHSSRLLSDFSVRLGAQWLPPGLQNQSDLVEPDAASSSFGDLNPVTSLL